jgi:hypothetical protein
MMVRCRPTIRHTWHFWFPPPVIVAVLWLNGIWNLLGAFAKLWKAIIRFVVPVCPSVGTEQHGSHWTDFHEIWYLSIFRKTVEKIPVSLTSDKNNGYFTWIHLAHFFLEQEVFQSYREYQYKHFILSNPPPPFPQIVQFLWGNVEKYARAGEPADGNMAHALCMLDT